MGKIGIMRKAGDSEVYVKNNHYRCRTGRNFRSFVCCPGKYESTGDQ